MAKIPKTRKFAISTYLSEEQLKNVLEKNRSIIYRWAYAHHDKDIKEDGSPKEPHTHVWIEFTQPYAISKPRNLFKGFLDSKGKEVNTMIEFQKKTDAHCIQYFIHKGYEDKAQYDKSIIKSSNVEVDYLLSLNLETSDSNDNSFAILSTLVEKGFYHTNLMELAKLYGKDFIYHWRNYKELATTIIDARRVEAMKLYRVNKDGVLECIGEEIQSETMINKLDEVWAEHESRFEDIKYN